MSLQCAMWDIVGPSSCGDRAGLADIIWKHERATKTSESELRAEQIRLGFDSARRRQAVGIPLQQPTY